MAKGHIERLPGGSFRVSVYAGKDPITHRKKYLKETHPTEAAAVVARERMLAQVEGDRVPDSARRTLSVLLDRWVEVADHDLTTADTTEGYIRRTIKPTLGDMPLRKLQYRVDLIDRLYAHLLRCSKACQGHCEVGNGLVRSAIAWSVCLP
jgi:hypothetical protein